MHQNKMQRDLWRLRERRKQIIKYKRYCRNSVVEISVLLSILLLEFRYAKFSKELLSEELFTLSFFLTFFFSLY